MNFQALQSLVSQPRLQSYLDACLQDQDKTIWLYQANIALSQELSGAINWFEVILRNMIDQQYTARWQNWLVDTQVTNSFLSASNRKCRHSIDRINATIDKLNKQNKTISHNNIVGELSFGFWVTLFEENQFYAGKKELIRVFFQESFVRVNEQTKRNFRLKDSQIRILLYDKLKTIQLLRNRIAHHEPICIYKKVINTTKTALAFQTLLELLKWMGVNAPDYISNIPQINRIIHNINSLHVK
jgi:hypothetical protein